MYSTPPPPELKTSNTNVLEIILPGSLGTEAPNSAL
jgi:hypothetical protein